MFAIRIAGLDVEIDNRYMFVEALCQDYIVQHAGEKADFRVRVAEHEITAYARACGRPMTFPEAEAHLIYRRICEQFPRYNGLLIHSAAVEMDGRAYLFSAPRGVGKTTHTNLWLQHFKGRARVINGDKPIIRQAEDGRFWVYGTPWCGKEGIQENRRAPLTAICFLEQGSTNCIRPALIADTAARILEGTVLPPDAFGQEQMARLVGSIVRDTPAYVLTCRPDVEAAEVAYEWLSQI